MAVGTASPITINVIAPSTAGDITNQALVSSVTAESDGSNNSVSEVTTVDAVAAEQQADLSLSLADSADQVNTGTALSWIEYFAGEPRNETKKVFGVLLQN
ncbi:MAG: hypothetical protein B6247_12355 [Candidatus Parabeggiatoa sp. nov. 2]|nr:MAG: hypothetical protein B6247_12355 [Beggiatoa sp. 4572_84]